MSLGRLGTVQDGRGRSWMGWDTQRLVSLDIAGSRFRIRPAHHIVYWKISLRFLVQNYSSNIDH